MLSYPERANPLRALTLLAILVLTAAPARAVEAPLLRSLQPPYFNADLTVGVDSTSHARVGVTVTIPYGELNWARQPNGFSAGVGISVEFEPDRRERLYGDAWERRVLVAAYAATRSPRNSLLETRTVDVPPGRYKVHVTVRDLGSEQESRADDVLLVDDLSKVPVGFGAVELGVLDSAGVLTVLPTRRFGFNVDHLAARVTALDRRPGPWPRTATFRVRFANEEGEPLGQRDTALTMDRPSQSIVVRAPQGELFIGHYSLTVERVEGKARWQAARSFDVEESGPPRGREYTQLLEALSYIAEPGEIERMRAAPADQQAAAWDRFWLRRDPTPDTPTNEFEVEFFRRLKYADQHFQGYGPGWRSDMGRIYLRHGQPDQIEQQPASTGSAQREIWYYNQPYHRFVFEDREGFGRFTLLNAPGE